MNEGSKWLESLKLRYGQPSEETFLEDLGVRGYYFDRPCSPIILAQWLFLDEEIDYAISVVVGSTTHGLLEIFDGDTLFKDIERYGTAKETARRLNELFALARRKYYEQEKAMA